MEAKPIKYQCNKSINSFINSIDLMISPLIGWCRVTLNDYWHLFHLFHCTIIDYHKKYQKMSVLTTDNSTPISLF